MRSGRRGIIVVAVIGIALLLASTLIGRTAEDDKGILASLVSRALSTPATRVSIGEVDGALSSDATIHDISIADRDGVWLRLDKVRLIWSRSALLLSQRLEVDRLEIGDLQILRRPLPSEQAVSDNDAPLLPQFPVKVIVKAFSLHQLALGAPVLGQAARLSASGKATLGNPSEGLDLQFDAHRLDAPGSATARLQLVPKTQALTVKLAAQEPANGLIVNAANVPGRPPLSLDLTGTGTLDAFAAQLAFDAGKDIGANGDAHVQRIANARRLTLDLKARIAGLLPAPAAPVFAGTTQLDGTLDFADDGGIALAPLKVQSQTASLAVTGTLSAQRVADLHVVARALPNAGRRTAAGNISIGKLAFDAKLVGPIAKPRVTATVEAADVRSPQGALQALTASFVTTPTDNSTALPFTANVKASGLAPADPALARALGRSAVLTLQGRAQDGIADLQNARLQTPTADIYFAGQIGQPKLQGHLSVAAPDLSRFGELAGMKLRGALNVRATLAGVPKDGQIAAAIDGHATGIATGVDAIDGLLGGRLALKGIIRKLPHGGYGFDDLRLDGAHFSARANGAAMQANAAIDVSLTIPELAHANRRLTGCAEARLRLTGTAAHPNADVRVSMTHGSALGRPVPSLTLEADATDLTGKLAGRASLSGSVGGKRATGTLQLARLAVGGWKLDDLDIRIGSATAEGDIAVNRDGLAAGRLTLKARDLDDLSPLALTKLAGSLDADLSLSVAQGGQSGNWRMRITRLVTAQTQSNGLPPVDVAASGRLSNGRSSVEGTVHAEHVGTFRVAGTVPLQGSGLDLRVRGAVDLGFARDQLSAAGRRVTGTANIDLRLRGSLAKPSADGEAVIAGGSYTDAELGVTLTDIAGRLTAHGTEVTIERLGAKTPDGGSLSASGNLRIDPDAGFPGSIRITGQRARLVANDIVTATANLSLVLSGPLARQPQISGKVDLVSLAVAIPERLSSTLSPLPGTQHVNAPPVAAARLAALARAKARAYATPPFDAALDLVVSAPNRVFVRGRGIDAELGGQVRLHGRMVDPVTIGAFELRRGRMSIAGTRLDFTSGRLEFAGSFIPNLNFVAQTRASDITVTITVTGSATAPSFAFSSDPALPPEEILSQLLFAKASGGLSAAQAIQVAQVAAQFSGTGGADVFERVRRALGVDSLDVSMGASGDPRVGVSRAINRRISIGVKAGTQPENSGVSVDIDVTRHIRAKGEIDRNGGTAVGVGMQWEY